MGGKVSFSKLRENEIYKFCQHLINMAKTKGMDSNPAPLLPIRSACPARIEKTLSDIHTKHKARLSSMGNIRKQLHFLITIFPEVSGSYGRIKRVCETELGIISQCCQTKQAMKCNKQYLENLTLKINVKVGGRDTLLDAIDKKIPLVTNRPIIMVRTSPSYVTSNVIYGHCIILLTFQATVMVLYIVFLTPLKQPVSTEEDQNRYATVVALYYKFIILRLLLLWVVFLMSRNRIMLQCMF